MRVRQSCCFCVDLAVFRLVGRDLTLSMITRSVRRDKLSRRTWLSIGLLRCILNRVHQFGASRKGVICEVMGFIGELRSEKLGSPNGSWLFSEAGRFSGIGNLRECI
ncbi:hypothetical protein AVEN_162989-1 [Araneus ventricosus]|uniref:Uncharacterized protein n=1 Tax=Araneus ventricosus TaxID=182803 RepID=A0A4Y2BZN5_ARAVE|nr:hypothetical protein AVEN_162989-1 [Araneus ventricosus]